MGIERLRHLRGEAEDAFAVENDTPALLDIRALDITVTAEQLSHDKAVHRQRITEALDQVMGRKSAGSRLSFGCHLTGDGVALDASATAADDILQNLLELTMGGSDSDKGAVCAADCTTTVINVGAGTGTRFAPGAAIMVEGTGPSGENEISIIESISTDALTLKIALSSAPSADDEVWNSYTAYVDPSATATWQFQAVGDDSADAFLMLGCVGGLSLANLLQTQDLARINFDLFCTKWEKDTQALADISATYDGAALLATNEDMEIHYQTHGTTTRNLIGVSALEIMPGITWTELAARGNADKEHIARVRMTQCQPTATLTADPSAAFWTAHTAQTDKMLVIMFGRTAGSSWCIELPKVRIASAPTRAAHAEQIATTINLRAYEDDCGDASTAMMRSPIRIHRL